MYLQYFHFDSIEKLSNAKNNLKKHYPNIAFISNADKLTLAVDSENSVILDSRISSFIQKYEGTPVDKE